MPLIPRFLTRRFGWPRLASLPLFWQVLSLSLVVLIATLLINTLLVLKAPSPPPPGYTITDAVTALKDGKVKLRNGRWLKAQTVDSPPEFVARKDKSRDERGFGRRLEPLLKARIASQLGVSPDTVFVELRLRRKGRDLFDKHLHNRPSPNDPAMVFQSGPDPRRGPPANDMAAHVPPDMDKQVTFPAFSVAWKQSDGTYRLITPPKPWIEPWQLNLLIGFVLTALLILPLAFWLSRRLTRPITALVQGAEQMSFDSAAQPLMPSGPSEVRAAAEVLNAMQIRLKKQVESRTALIAAIAHDLKTPLARLRLRIESLPEPARDKITQDIAHMDSLINSALNFASADKIAQTLTKLDLSSLMEILCDDMADVHEVTCGSIEHGITVIANDIAIRRIVTNLIENACRYGGGCEVIVRTAESRAEVIIRDHGPGMPPEALEAVFEPFYRLETSRNRDTGGAGLGLSVARTLSEAIGGNLRLENRYEAGTIVGLDARFTLPKFKAIP